MLDEIRCGLDKAICEMASGFEKAPFSALPPEYRRMMQAYLLHGGKQIRPILFMLSYAAYAGKATAGAYRSAVSLELLHDFVLIHDDIIDRDASRRGGASIHARLNEQLNGVRGGSRFRGEDVAIVVGDMLYALALDSFVRVRQDPRRRERALQYLTRAALHTGVGELHELICSMQSLDVLKLRDVQRIYDWKTARYSFAAPLAMGATMGGADTGAAGRLYQAGIQFGRAYQVQNDLLDFSEDNGRKPFSDLRERRPTIVMWYAYRRGGAVRDQLDQLWAGGKNDDAELRRTAELVEASGAMNMARGEMKRLVEKGSKQLAKLKMNVVSRELLLECVEGWLSEDSQSKRRTQAA